MRLLLLLLALPFFSVGQNHQQFQFDGPAILIHGGAGGIERKYYTDEQIASYDSALRVVLQSGYALLNEGANGMDVVVHCLTLLENDPHFNAGRGAVFNDMGEVELDASVMNGATKKAGAVAGLKHVKNPAKLARDVMDHTPRCFIDWSGSGGFCEDSYARVC